MTEQPSSATGPEDGPGVVDERTMLMSYLGAQREHVLQAVAGLSDVALRRPVLPSGWSCVGLVQHLTLDVERFWFRGAMAGDAAAVEAIAATENDGWLVGADVPVESVLEQYRQETLRADEIIAATALDAGKAWWPEGLFGDWSPDNLRQIILHVMVETACHAGHLDAARELIDGTQWLVLR